MDGVTLTPLKNIKNPRGNVLHVIKKSSIGFNGFGEAYFSLITKNTIKGWKKHNQMILNIVVASGKIEFVIFDDRTNKFFQIILSKDNYQRLSIMPGLWVAFRGLSDNNMLLNIASIEHDPKESVNIGLSEIQYDW